MTEDGGDVLQRQVLGGHRQLAGADGDRPRIDETCAQRLIAAHAVSAACARHALAARLLRLPEHPDVHQLVLVGDARERASRSSLDNWTTYTEALDRYQPQFLRSLVYGGAATIICFLIAYPLAYTIAFRGGRYKNLLLFLVIAPFFTSFLLRTQSWKIILGDDGILFGPLKDIGLLPPEFRVLATPAAVIAGIAYNFLPFMTLPIYVSLEKIDGRLVEAAKDLYAGPWRPGGTIAGAVIGALVGGGLAAALSYDVLVLAGARTASSASSSARSSSRSRSSGSSCRSRCRASSPGRC